MRGSPSAARRRALGPGGRQAVPQRAILSAIWPALALGLLILLAQTGRPMAQAFPARLIQFIVPFGAGGASDVLARQVADAASKILRQPIIIENRPGAGGNIGMGALTRSPPDGYTIGLCGQNCAATESLYSPPPFRTTSFAAVTSLAELPLVLVASPDLGTDDAPGLRELARKTPRGLSYGSPGVGTSNHLATAILERILGIKMVSVSYRSGAAVLIDLAAGRVDLYFDTVSSALPQIESRTVKALAVTGTARAPQLPGVPTMAEAGLKGLEVSPRALLLAPAGTPPAVIDALNRAFREALADPKVAKSIVDLGGKPLGDTPAEAGAYLAADAERLGAIIRENKIAIE